MHTEGCGMCSAVSQPCFMYCMCWPMLMEAAAATDLSQCNDRAVCAVLRHGGGQLAIDVACLQFVLVVERI